MRRGFYVDEPEARDAGISQSYLEAAMRRLGRRGQAGSHCGRGTAKDSKTRGKLEVVGRLLTHFPPMASPRRTGATGRPRALARFWKMCLVDRLAASWRDWKTVLRRPFGLVPGRRQRRLSYNRAHSFRLGGRQPGFRRSALTRSCRTQWVRVYRVEAVAAQGLANDPGSVMALLPARPRCRFRSNEFVQGGVERGMLPQKLWLCSRWQPFDLAWRRFPRSRTHHSLSARGDNAAATCLTAYSSPASLARAIPFSLTIITTSPFACEPIPAEIEETMAIMFDVLFSRAPLFAALDSHTTSCPSDMIASWATCGYRPFSAMLSRSEARQK